MRILHVSDLHIGHHNDVLLNSLKTNVRTLRPDLILATGDFADQPDRDLLVKAKKYLDELTGLCADGEGPKLIAIPGNHDFSLFGNFAPLMTYSTYRGVFGSVTTNHFYEQQRLWIYGFNSARHYFGAAWANGEVPRKELADFAAEYARLKAALGTQFDNAFKIVALHHHPLPISFNKKYSRWVSLLNAGEFLEEMIKKEIDLVVHGHEHVHAKATFGKRVGGGDGKLSVVSVGALLAREAGPDYNRFNVIHIDPTGEVRIDSHQARGAIFDTAPADVFFVRTFAEAAAARFEQATKEHGFKYGRVNVETKLTADGDAFRSIEFHDFDLRDGAVERSHQHRIMFPETSGYIDLPSSHRCGSGEPLASRWKPLLNGKSGEVTVDYGVRLQQGDSIDVCCQWWAVNAMAMSKSQFDRKYLDNSYQELTHFPVVDPIEELVWVARFPAGFAVKGIGPYVAKMTPDGDGHKYTYTRYASLEEKLRDAIDFDQENKRVHMRIRRPLIGHSYGLRWTVPDDARSQVFDGRTIHIVDRLVEFHGQDVPDPATKEALSRLMVPLAEFTRDTLAQKSTGHLEVSLMVFDLRSRRMVTPAAVKLEGSLGEWVDRRTLLFEYGEGLGGRSFKTREIRLYTDQPKKELPDYYRRVDGAPSQAILLSIPISHPTDDQNVYAVLNCGSRSKASPLGKLGAGGSIIPASNLGIVREALNQICYTQLSAMFP